MTVRVFTGPTLFACILLLLQGIPNTAHSQESPKGESGADPAQQAGAVLRRTCYRCHKGQGSESGYAFNVLKVDSLIDEGMVVAGDHEESEIYQAMFSGRMPPRNRPQLPRPTAQEVELIARWISGGAAAIPRPAPRTRLSLNEQLQGIRDHLRSLKREQRLNTRYFTLTHLHNDSSVDAEQLNATRRALTKTLNSMSWEPLAVIPEPIDKEQTVYAVDISRLGWRRDHWNALVSAYPYALSYAAFDDVELNDLDRDIDGLRDGDQQLVAIRADWLVAVGAKPPLYYALLFDRTLPELRDRRADPTDPANPKAMTDADLEHYLGVDVLRNFLEGKVARSAFTESGVSGQNRMIERHSLKSGGFYWKSYDFKSSNRTAILSEFSLGPRFADNPFQELAFDHDGGEIIFSLPNGLQGYLLVDAKGRRIDAGPIEVVADSLRTSGNEQIVSGVSCIACHRRGMIEPPTDEVRAFTGAVGAARDHVRRIYPEDADFRKLIAADADVFRRGLAAIGQDAGPDLPEPVGEVARHYHLEPMNLETVAAELHLSADRLRGGLESNPELRRFGLRVLLRDGGTIKRAAWESPSNFSLMQQVAQQFGYSPR